MKKILNSLIVGIICFSFGVGKSNDFNDELVNSTSSDSETSLNYPLITLHRYILSILLPNFLNYYKNKWLIQNVDKNKPHISNSYNVRNVCTLCGGYCRQSRVIDF